MSTPLSKLYAQQGVATNSFAPVYPSQLAQLSLDDFLPGSFGTYVNGIWQKLGDIKTAFNVSYTIPDPQSVEGWYHWGSEHLSTKSVWFNGSVWVVGEDAGGDGAVGIQYNDSSDTLFSVMTGDISQYEIDASLLDQLVEAVLNEKNGSSLRFVTSLSCVDSLIAFGGTSKSASCVVTGNATAIGEAGKGHFTAGLSIATTNVSELQVCLTPGTEMLAFGLYLYEIGKNGKQMNNNPE